jgi:hypothetical protein
MESAIPEITHEQINVARLQLKPWKPEPWPLTDYGSNRKPTTPSEWFSEKFPVQAKIFGCPFAELVEDQSDGFKRVNPLAPNLDFLAAILGGDEKMGHKVVYVESEMQWYFLDARTGIFKPTTAEKLGNLLRALLIRCAEELPDNVHKLNLFLEFRSEKTIKTALHRAKSILAADHTFFSVDSKHQRQKGPEIHERVARVFVERVLERQPGTDLTLNNAHLIFTEFLKCKEMVPVERKIFKGLLCPLVRDVFDVGLRHDILNPQTKKQGDGWRGIRALDLDNALVRQ